MAHAKSDKKQHRPKKANHVWQTWWSVIGPRLPHRETRVSDQIVFAPIDEAEFERKKKGRVSPSLSSEHSHIAHYPPRDEVQSHHRLQIDVEANNEDDAQGQATAIAESLLASLTLTVPGGRYHAELRALRRADHEGETYPYSESITFAPLEEPEELGRQHTQDALHIKHSIDSDPIAGNAYSHLLKAWRLQDTAGSKPLERSVLQHFVLCMESIVTQGIAKIRPEMKSNIEAKEREFAKKFSDDLPHRADKPAAIRQASTELRAIALQNTLPMIDEIGPRIKVSPENIQSAKELFQFRSRSLSHPGNAKDEELSRWLTSEGGVDQFCEAERVARAFLRGYCDNMVPRKA